MFSFPFQVTFGLVQDQANPHLFLLLVYYFLGPIHIKSRNPPNFHVFVYFTADPPE